MAPCFFLKIIHYLKCFLCLHLGQVVVAFCFLMIFYKKITFKIWFILMKPLGIEELFYQKPLIIYKGKCLWDAHFSTWYLRLWSMHVFQNLLMKFLLPLGINFKYQFLNSTIHMWNTCIWVKIDLKVLLIACYSTMMAELGQISINNIKEPDIYL